MGVDARAYIGSTFLFGMFFDYLARRRRRSEPAPHWI
jgi:hypothetical protein